MQDLLEKLLKFEKENPDDPFILYGLALEYLKTDEKKAAAYFDRLISDHADYLPAYYHFGCLLTRQGNEDKAIRVFEKGYDLAISKGDNKTANEIDLELDDLYD